MFRFTSHCRTANGLLLKSDTNHSGGTLGGVTNGEIVKLQGDSMYTGNNIVFRVAFKPVSSISLTQRTLSFEGKMEALEIKGRHDPCVLPRTAPLVESMTALVLADLALRQRARAGPSALPVISSPEI